MSASSQATKRRNTEIKQSRAEKYAKPAMGIEPKTFRLQDWPSASWAIGPLSGCVAKQKICCQRLAKKKAG